MPTQSSQGNFAQQQAQQQNYFSRPHRPRNTLPPPAELAQRIEEARTSAKLLSQVVGTTPPNEILGNELIKEFVDRCQSASRSIQAYIHADSPGPDDDTLLTLIETNDQLAAATSKHQRALLEARKRAGLGTVSLSPSPNPPPVTQTTSQNRSYPTPEPTTGQAYIKSTDFASPPPPGPRPGRKPIRADGNTAPYNVQNPFGDQNDVAHPGTADLQAPLQPHLFGLPPHGITGGSGAGTYATNGETVEGNGRSREVSHPAPPPAQTPPMQASTKPRYRF